MAILIIFGKNGAIDISLESTDHLPWLNISQHTKRHITDYKTLNPNMRDRVPLRPRSGRTL